MRRQYLNRCPYQEESSRDSICLNIASRRCVTAGLEDKGFLQPRARHERPEASGDFHEIGWTLPCEAIFKCGDDNVGRTLLA